MHRGFSVFVGLLYAVGALIFLVSNSIILGQFGYKFGHGEVAKWLFAAVAGSVPWMLAPHLHVMAAKRRAYGKRRWLSGLFGMIPFLVIYVIFVGYNVLGGTGATAFARTEVAEERKFVIKDTERIEQQRAALKSQLDAVPQHRPKETVAPLIEAHKKHRFWTATGECKDELTSKAQRNYCAEYLQLQAEIASAGRGDELLQKITDLDSKLGDTKRQVSEADPQVAFLTNLTKLSQDQVLMILLLATPLILEIGALYWGKQALEILNIHIHIDTPQEIIPPSRRLAAPSVARTMAIADVAEAVQFRPLESAGVLANDDPAFQRVVYDRFWAECTRPLASSRSNVVDLYSTYRSFCSRPNNRVQPYDLDTFLRFAGDRRTVSQAGVTWILGIVIADPLREAAE